MSFLSLFNRRQSLYITAYDRGTDTKTGLEKPEHWAIFIGKSADAEGNIYQVVHSHPFFEYRLQAGTVHQRSVYNLKRVLIVAKISERDVGKAEKAFEEVHVDNGNAQWNCQSWVISAIKALEGLELVVKGTSHGLREAVAATPPTQS